MRSNNGTLNAQLARVISEVGHTDLVVVTDAGLPIPNHVERVDLALKQGIPAFLDVLDTVLAELRVEGAIVPEEIAEHSPEMLAEIRRRLEAADIEVAVVPHEEFKVRTTGARAAVRSGEFTPYANVILQAGVVY
ncbi:MAG: D-ribose pyranase [Nocardioidaceae bacterium]